MAPSKRSKAKAVETSPMCRKCLSTDGTLESVTSNERGEYLLQQTFSCTNVQMKLFAGFPTYLCSACKSRFDFLDKLRSIWMLNNAKIERLKQEVDTTHLRGSETTAKHSDTDMQQIGGVGSVVKTQVVAEDSEEDYQSSQTVSELQQISTTYDYNLHDDLFEAEEESLETLLKREPIDDPQQPQSSDAELKHKHNILKTDPFDVEGEASVAGKTITGPDDPASISDQSNLGTKYAAEGPILNQMVIAGNQPVSVIGEQRLLRSNKRRSSQKDIAATEFSVSSMQRSKVNCNVHKNKKKHKCPHCSATYPNTSKLKSHIRTHTGERPFSCKVCSKTFHAARILRVHMKIHDRDQHQCPHCSDKFAMESRLKDHIRTHTGEKPFQCKVCSKAFHVASNLRVHEKIHNKDHQCPYCHRQFARHSQLKNHIRTHTGEKPFQCEVCSKRFYSANNLRTHMQIHPFDVQGEASMAGKTITGPDDPAAVSDHNNLGTEYAAEGPTFKQMDPKGEAKSKHTDNQRLSVVGERRLLRSNKRRSSRKDIAAAQFSVSSMQRSKVNCNVHRNKKKHKCPHCSATYLNTSKLKSHIRTHTGEKPFQCEVCSKTFHAANNLYNHKKIHNKDQHQCPHCSGKFALQSHLNDHIRTHTGEKPFMCKVCSKTFHAARILRLHMQIHDKDQHQCPQCPDKFARQSQLQNHIRTHTGEKPFPCKVCSKAFHSAAILREHMHIHNKDQLQCPHCSRKFAHQRELKVHIRTHTGEKPFSCKVCNKTFHGANNLYIHMKTHNKDQHQCPHCTRKFARQYRLKDHIRTHTGE